MALENTLKDARFYIYSKKSLVNIVFSENNLLNIKY